MGETQGTVVPAVYRSACSGDLSRLEDLWPELHRALEKPMQLEQLLRGTWPEPGYFAIFGLLEDSTTDRWNKFTLLINETGVRAVIHGCPTWTSFPKEWSGEVIYMRPAGK